MAHPKPVETEASPSPAEIRALRAGRSRAEFGALVGVTGLTVYRWELAPDSPESRRPRGKVLARLRAFIAAQAEPAPPVTRPLRAAPLDGEEQAALAPVLALIDDCQLERAEAELLALLASGLLRSSAGQARASIALARIQLLARHDTRGAFATLLGAGSDVTALPRAVQLEYHLTAALLHALPDVQLFNAGKTHHHAALAEALLGEGTGDHRFSLWHAHFMAAMSLYEIALMARAMEGLPAVRDLATTVLHRCLVDEADTVASLGLTNLAESARRVDRFGAQAASLGLPLQQVRALIWRAEIDVEQAADPAAILSRLGEAESLLHRHRIADGIHSMLLGRNRGETLMRLGRLREAETAFLDAAQVARNIAYTPLRILTALAGLYLNVHRPEATARLADEARQAEDAQKELTRAFGAALALLADLQAGRVEGGWYTRLAERLHDLRRLGVWPVAYRQLTLHALAVGVRYADVDGGERLLQLAERALEWCPSPSATAILRRHRGVMLMRRGRLTESRQSLEAALAALDAAADRIEGALARRSLATLAALEAAPESDRLLAETEAELMALEVAIPPLIDPVRAAAPAPAVAAEDAASRGLQRLVVPLARLTTRGLAASAVQKELLAVAAELFPGRTIRLEEVDSTGGATELGARNPAGSATLEWFDFSDGGGRRLRLGLGGAIEPETRAVLQIMATTAALALEIAGLRGFSEPGRAADVRSAPVPEVAGLPEFVATSPAMRRLKAELGRLSGSRATIIVTGESGTGKEVVARAIHDLSRRASGPYVTFNSAAIPRDLFEGQLFGYRKGAFTGATSDHLGVIRAASGGTLFLDEIGELPLDVQPKLLRFLENGEVLPLGERKPVTVDVRIIAATHRDLLSLVRAGKFREDLYYRLQVIPVTIAPLRDRREDVIALARFFLRKLTPPGRVTPALTPEAEARLLAHRWPGNVRELRNVIDRCLAFDPLPAVLRAEDFVL